MRRRPGDSLGHWRLKEPLGEGGHSEVWRVESNAGTVAALKILHNRQPQSEPYRRFAREVEVQRGLTSEAFPGVLPLVEASVPASPTRESPAWLAMPVAQTMSAALGSSPPLPDVVEAHAAIADTLSALAEREIFHRDVKPPNLYKLDGEWLVGDLGLVALPDAEPLTTGTKGLGPRHFLAPEMLRAPDAALGGPADVYSLAKCLWVCATGQRVPLPGEQRIDVPALRLSSYVSGGRADILDVLIDRATRTDVDRRPTMREFAAELRAWLSTPAEPADAADLTTYMPEVQAVLEPARAAAESAEQRKRAARASLLSLKASLKQMEMRLGADVGLPPLRPSAADHQGLIRRIGGNWLLRNEEWTEVVAIKVGRHIENESRFLDNSPRSIYLWGAGLIRVTPDGKAVLAAGYAIGRIAEQSYVTWAENGREAIGSALEAELLARLLRGLEVRLPEAVAKLVEVMRPRSDRRRPGT